MNTKTEIKDDPSSPAITISFWSERVGPPIVFDAIFKGGMALVERTASYLDGPAAKVFRLLRGPVWSCVYATESMRPRRPRCSSLRPG